MRSTDPGTEVKPDCFLYPPARLPKEGWPDQLRTIPFAIIYWQTHGSNGSGSLTYTAKDIGRAAVQQSVVNGFWVSNLKLQKVLYFAWIEYFRRYRKPLFKEGFEAWRYGPVVPSVYYDNWCNAANTLVVPKRTSVPVDQDTQDFLREMLEEFKDVSVGDMVELSHKTRAWSKNYILNKKCPIPREDMEAEASHLWN